MKKIICTALTLSALSVPALADIDIRFQESAPKDRFIISTTTCATGPLEITIDLAPSAGALIFDVTASGAGVEVFQPVEVQSGGAQVAPVIDGDQQLALTLPALQQGADVIISADLDDVLPQSSLGQIRVTGSELDGATVQISAQGQIQTAVFAGGSNRVSIPQPCLS